jgi:hypothetical protein
MVEELRVFNCKYETSTAIAETDVCLWPVAHPNRERCTYSEQCADRLFLLALCEVERRVAEPRSD